mmetsp:Transcript_30259/g.41883  ORF Transcript_30259/g.41883 Transcript_30259/m.41883 type:complete len:189 (+) Transcript_30259:227-793(+)
MEAEVGELERSKMSCKRARECESEEEGNKGRRKLGRESLEMESEMEHEGEKEKEGDKRRMKTKTKAEDLKEERRKDRMKERARVVKQLKELDYGLVSNNILKLCGSLSQKKRRRLDAFIEHLLFRGLPKAVIEEGGGRLAAEIARLNCQSVDPEAEIYDEDIEEYIRTPIEIEFLARFHAKNLSDCED